MGAILSATNSCAPSAAVEKIGVATFSAGSVTNEEPINKKVLPTESANVTSACRANEHDVDKAMVTTLALVNLDVLSVKVRCRFDELIDA